MSPIETAGPPVKRPGLTSYLMRQADNALILGQRLVEWCGHGPVLEQDIALSNIALDLIGQASHLFRYAAEKEEAGRTEDDLAFLRDAPEDRNILLVELPNRDFAYTLARQFLFDAFHLPFLESLCESKDPGLAAIAAKSVKEVSYHRRFSSEWMIRLGDGTDESHRRVQEALDRLWPYAGEMLEADPLDQNMAEMGVGADLGQVSKAFHGYLDLVLPRATLKLPPEAPYQGGGKQGRHTEHMDYLLAEMQYMQRRYPGMEW